jgi:hypothetical protein
METSEDREEGKKSVRGEERRKGRNRYHIHNGVQEAPRKSGERIVSSCCSENKDKASCLVCCDAL